MNGVQLRNLSTFVMKKQTDIAEDEENDTDVIDKNRDTI